MFFEGICSYGWGLLFFKIGVFYIVMSVDVLVVFVCMSIIYKIIKLNCWDNGIIYFEMLVLIYFDKDVFVCDYVFYVY